MATQTYVKPTNNPYQVGQLQSEINSDPSIVPSCTEVSGVGEDLTLTFAAPLSTDEEAALDALILAHIPEPQSVDAVMFPLSEIDGKKLAVHTSSKPYVPGIKTYAVWTGCGDDVDGTTDIGDGPLVHLDAEVGTPMKSVDVKFLPEAGRVWIHEGYLMFDGGGEGDHMSADICAEPTPTQFQANIDYIFENNWMKPAPGGPGTGTHGLAANPILVPRTFSKDGWWDFDGTNLSFNAEQKGAYHISDIERTVHRYINRIPCTGSSYGYFTMSSNETTELPAGYFMRITQHNVSDTSWHASVIMEIYRERTHDP